MSVKDIVVERFQELCSERGINTNELATRSGVTPSTAYSMMDKNRRDISIVTIKKFCDGLDITLGEFLFHFGQLAADIFIFLCVIIELLKI